MNRQILITFAAGVTVGAAAAALLTSTPAIAAPDRLPYELPPMEIEALDFDFPRYIGMLQATCIWWKAGYVPTKFARQFVGSLSENIPDPKLRDIARYATLRLTPTCAALF